jgi:2-polyprenylphenol 6-hydroxylase
MQAQFDVVIVGRGLVGMAAARAVSLLGMTVALVGPAPEVDHAQRDGALTADLRVYALSPGTQTFLEDIKVWAALEQARISPVTAMRVYSPKSDELVFGASETSVDTLNHVVEHSNLQKALERSLTFSSVTVFNEKVQEMHQESRTASLKLVSGLLLKAKLVVAADGIDSSVRSLAQIDVDRKDYADRALVANLETELPHHGAAWQWFSEDGIVAFLPLASPHQMSLVWSGSVEHSNANGEQTASDLGLRLCQLSNGSLGDVKVIGETKRFALTWLKAEQMVGPRLVLIGDAAHSMHPLAGQGLNLGFGDLASLCTVLKARLKGQDIGELRFLRQYQRARAEPVETMLFVTDQLHEVFTQTPQNRSQKLKRSVALLGWGQLASPNPLARQIRKLLAQHALA